MHYYGALLIFFCTNALNLHQKDLMRMEFTTAHLISIIEQTDLRHELHQDQIDDLLLALDQKERSRHKLEERLTNTMLSHWQRRYEQTKL